MEAINVKEESLTVAPRRVLIIDDDPSQVPIWTYILGKLDPDFHIEWATSYEEAEAMLFDSFLEERPYAVVIADIVLEGKRTGVELWSRYHRLMDGRIFFTSGMGYGKYLRELEKTDLEEIPTFLPKPLETNTCFKAVYYALNRVH
jgi:DNA-binding NtrC family response regulator